MTDLIHTIKQRKRNKNPGLDTQDMDCFKELDANSLKQILMIINDWWHNEEFDDASMEAIVFVKNCDRDNLANYRPISLLNSLYKFIASIVQTSISGKFDSPIQETQYGFRKKRGTADAIHYIRRLIETGESLQGQTLLVLFDWGKHLIK